MLRRFSTAAAVVVVFVLGTALAASAHVTIEPGTAPKGGTDQELTFRVPTESDTANTVKLDMKVPTDHPLLGVAPQAMPGWKIDVKTTKLAKPVTTDDGTITEAVSEIIWSGGSIPPGEFGEFRLIVGQLPEDADQLTFPVIQTYSDGSEVSWIQVTPPGGQEPEHPAPVLELTGAAAPDGGSTTETTGGSETTATTAPSGGVAISVASQGDVDSANTKATIGIVIGLLGLAAGVAAILLSRRRS